jgi:hypothetical protein
MIKKRMSRDEKHLEIIMEIYRRMYRETDPPLDFDEHVRSGKAQENDWFRNHYLSDERQLEIIEEVLKENKITQKYLKQSFRFTVLLGVAPTPKKL